MYYKLQKEQLDNIFTAGGSTENLNSFFFFFSLNRVKKRTEPIPPLLTQGQIRISVGHALGIYQKWAWVQNTRLKPSSDTAKVIRS